MNGYELYHHGVKGQRWGVRRTPAQLGHKTAGAAGKSKIAKIKNAAVKSTKKAIRERIDASKEKRYYEKLKKKKLSKMTDKEIEDLTARVKKEAALKDAEYESRVQNARKFYNNVAKQPVNSFANTLGTQLAKKLVDGVDKTDSKKGSKEDKGSKEEQNKGSEENSTSTKENTVHVAGVHTSKKPESLQNLRNRPMNVTIINQAPPKEKRPGTIDDFQDYLDTNIDNMTGGPRGSENSGKKKRKWF